MHALEVIVTRNLKAAGREAAHISMDGGDSARLQDMLDNAPRRVSDREAHDIFWAAFDAAVKAENRE